MANRKDLRVTQPENLIRKAKIKRAKTGVSISEKVEEALKEWAGDVELEETDR